MAGIIERIAVIVDAVKDGAVRGLNDTGRAAEGMAGKTKGANLALGFLNRTGLAQTSIGQRLVSNIESQGTALGGLRESGIGVGSMMGVAIPAAAAVGTAAIAKFALDGVEKFGAATAEVRGLQRTMGDSAEDASRLRFAAKALGIDLNAVERGAGLMAKSIGNGTSKLKDYGVQIAHDKQGNVDMSATIANVAQAFQETDDPARRAAIGAAAFGRGWQQMAPILGKSKSELRDLYDTAASQHQIFNQKDLDDGRKMSLAMRELKTEIDGLEIEVGKGLVPVLTEGTQTLTELMGVADKIVGPLGGVGNVIGGITDAAIDSVPGVGMMHQALGLLGGSSDDSSDKAKKHAAAERKRAAAVQQAKEKTQEETKALLDNLNAIQGEIDTDLNAEQAQRQLADSIGDYLVKQKAATDAKGKDAAKNKELDDATFALKQQINSTAEAVAAKAAADYRGKDAVEKARLSNDAYRGALMEQAQSAIPAVRLQALQLIADLDRVSGEHVGHVSLDTSQAVQAIIDLTGRWDAFAVKVGNDITSGRIFGGP